jgi:hypothetical protein
MAGMTDTKRTRLVRKKKVRTFGGRGQIYCWLRTHHAEIEPRRVVHLNLWAILTADMVEDGITEAAATRGLRDRIWKSWQRVCRDVAADATAAKPKRVPPSRISPDWRPTVVSPRPTAPTQQPVASSGAVVPSGRKSLVDPNDPPLVQAEMAKLERMFDELESKRLKLY